MQKLTLFFMCCKDQTERIRPDSLPRSFFPAPRSDNRTITFHFPHIYLFKHWEIGNSSVFDNKEERRVLHRHSVCVIDVSHRTDRRTDGRTDGVVPHVNAPLLVLL